MWAHLDEECVCPDSMNHLNSVRDEGTVRSSRACVKEIWKLAGDTDGRLVPFCYEFYYCSTRRCLLRTGGVREEAHCGW